MTSTTMLNPFPEDRGAKAELHERQRHRALMAACLALHAFSSIAAAAEPEDRPSASSSAASLKSYFDSAGAIINSGAEGSTATTLRDALRVQAETYASQARRLGALNVPREVRLPHQALLKALRDQASANFAAVLNAPANASNTDEAVNKYAHYFPEVGYARNDEAVAGCDVKRVATALGYSFAALGFCGDEELARAATLTLGSRSAPVNSVMLVQDVAVDPATQFPRPNVDGFQYGTIYVRANQPLNVTFDNRNPRPFVFSFSIYDNASSSTRVTASQLIAQTDAYSGANVQTVTTTLKPGVYAYVDNVHPSAMRGRLIAVP